MNSALTPNEQAAREERNWRIVIGIALSLWVVVPIVAIVLFA